MNPPPMPMLVGLALILLGGREPSVERRALGYELGKAT
jgi:hypothetical protein